MTDIYQNLTIFGILIVLGFTLRLACRIRTLTATLSKSMRTVRSQEVASRKERDSLKRPTLRNRELMKAANDINSGKLRNSSIH